MPCFDYDFETDTYLKSEFESTGPDLLDPFADEPIKPRRVYPALPPAPVYELTNHHAACTCPDCEEAEHEFFNAFMQAEKEAAIEKYVLLTRDQKERIVSWNLYADMKNAANLTQA